MVSAGDFKNGLTIEIEGNIFQILEFQHVKPGKGAAFVRTKLKNIKSGGVVEKTFRPTEKCPQARIDRKDMQYLYSDGDLYYFMDVENYEQIALDSLLSTIRRCQWQVLTGIGKNSHSKLVTHSFYSIIKQAIFQPFFVTLPYLDSIS